MIHTVTDYLDKSAVNYPEKIAFVDEKRSITFRELQDEAHHIAMQLINLGYRKNPVVIYLDKSVECICAFAGVVYSGNFYSPIDTHMPEERIKKIIGKLEPSVVLTDNQHKSEALKFANDADVFCYEEMQILSVDKKKIRKVTDETIDTDALYVLFTSGSTGTPKGAIISHRGMIDLTEWIASEFGFTHETIMANQSPFYFSFSVYEIYQTLRNGGTTYIVPQKLFSFPVQLMNYLFENKVNTIIWVPSILSYISTLKALNKPHLTDIKNIFFGAEVMPAKHLNRWMKEYPDVRFVNLYGPTEVTDTCTFFEITREFENDAMLPIGTACENKNVFLLDDEDKLVKVSGEIGEICVRGSGVSYGYYNDIEKTTEAFVQNPLNKTYKGIIYRTGDLGKYNSYGELIYVCRKDLQIKHKGHRIELGEIETACSSLKGIEENCCLYDSEKMRIVLFYVGDLEGKEVIEKLKKLLPDYMVPGKRIQLQFMPHNLNGKIDRQQLKQMINEM